MKKILLASAIALSASIGASTAEDESGRLTVERLHAEPSISGPSVRNPQISPDGTIVTLLKGRDDNARLLDLWAYDVSDGTARRLVKADDLVADAGELSEEEKNRRERQRIYDTGIVDYAWDSRGAAILFPLGGDVFLYDLEKSEPTQVTATEAFETDAKVSPDGRYVSYVRDDELFAFDRETGKERRLTRSASETVRNAVAEFVAQEELDRDTGYWWSPDDSRVAFTRIDEAPVEIAERLDFGPDGAKTIRQRYPFAGTDNVRINLAVVSATGGRPTWIDLGAEEDVYLADVYWSADGATLYAARLSRDQKRLDLLKADPMSGASEIILTETSDTWINLNHSFRALDDGGFLWGSERDGFHHVYRYDGDGERVAQLTNGDWPVSGVACVNEEEDALFFTGWMESALERHLFRTSLSGDSDAAPARVSQAAGWHGASFAGDCSAYIGTFSSENQPRQVAVYDNSGERRFWLSENSLDEDHPYRPYLASHVAPEYGTIDVEGVSLDYKLLKPTDLKRGEKRPAIILVYGGPHSQRVRKGWDTGFEQMLADEGYVVFRLDNRGAANRGKAFEDPLYRAMGSVEVRDQAAGARWLASQDFVDAEKIGVYGWSYGGYMTLMMLSQTPDLYAAGVSGAPVTEWRLYDTAYTERYMGDPSPEADAEAYDESAVFAHLDGLVGDGRLLLIHGMADDNVIFLNSIRLMDALQKAGKDFDLMTYPGEKHGFRAKTNRIDRDRRIMDFFNARLKKRD